jgi:hypothetical protein
MSERLDRVLRTLEGPLGDPGVRPSIPRCVRCSAAISDPLHDFCPGCLSWMRCDTDHDPKENGASSWSDYGDAFCPPDLSDAYLNMAELMSFYGGA